MKNKWLIGLVSAAMAVTLCFGLAACGGDEGGTGDDAAAVKNIISQVKTRELDRGKETPADYSVIGQAPYEGKNYAIAWSVSSEVEGYADYVKVGTMDETTKLVTIDVTLGGEPVDYTLTATVTVGSKTDSVSFEHVVPKTYTVAQANELAKTVRDGGYYAENGVIVPIVVSGYVTSVGDWDSKNSSYIKFYIGDTPTATDDETFYVYSVKADGVFLLEDGSSAFGGESAWEKGWFATFSGYLQNYGGTYELTYCRSSGISGDGNGHCLALDKTPLSNADKVTRAKNALFMSPSSFTAATTAAQDLTTSLEGATISWALKGTSDYATVENNKLTVSNVPETPATFTLVATISSGDAQDTKEFTVKVGPLPATGNDGTAAKPYTVAEAKALAETLANKAYYQVGGTDTKICVKGIVTDAGTYSSSYKNWNKVYIADEADAEKANWFYVYRILSDDTYLVNADDLQKGDEVIIEGYLQSYYGTLELTDKASNGGTVCVGHDKPTMSEEDRAKYVIAHFTLPTETRSDIKISTKSTLTSVTLSYASDNGEVITVDETNGKLVVTRSKTEDIDVTITVTATCGEKTESKTYTIKVKMIPPIDDGDYVFDFSANTVNDTNDLSNDVENNGVGDEATYSDICAFLNSMLKDADGIELISAVTNASKVYKGQGSGGAHENDPKIFKMGTSKYKGILALTLEKNISKIVIQCEQWKNENKGNKTLTVNGETVTIPVEKSDLTFEFVPTNTLTIESNFRVLIYKITVTVDSTEWTEDVKIGKTKTHLETAGVIPTEYDKLGSYVLPTDYLGASIAWTAEDLPASGVTLDGATLKITWLPATDTPIKLKAQITCGEGTAQNVTIDANLAEAPHLTEQGTADHPYTVADALAIAGILKSGAYYMGEETSAKQVYVHGFVIAVDGKVGDWDSKNSHFTNVYIVDADHKTETAKTNAIQIYKLVLGEHLILTGDLAVGAEITVYGFIQNYNGTFEISSNGAKTETKVSATAYIDSRAAADKQQAAIDAAKATIGTTVASDVEEVNLPDSTVTGVTLTYSGNGVTGKKLAVTHGATETTVDLTISAAYADVSAVTGTLSLTIAVEEHPQANLTSVSLLGYTDTTVNYGDNETGVPVNGVTFKWKNTRGNADSLQWNKTTSMIWNSTALQPVTKIVVNYQSGSSNTKGSIKVEWGTSEITTNQTKTETLAWNSASQLVFNAPTDGSYTFVRISYAGSGAQYLASIKIF